MFGAQFRGFEFFLAAGGFDVALFQRLGTSHLSIDVRLQLFIALLEGFEIAVAFIVLDCVGHRLLQRRQQLWIEVVLRQPFRRGFGHRTQQLPRRMIGTDKKRAVLQGDAQQRELHAFDQRGRWRVVADFALQMGVEQSDQIEGIAVAGRQRHRLTILLARLGQQRLLDVSDVWRRAARHGVGVHPAERLQQVAGGDGALGTLTGRNGIVAFGFGTASRQQLLQVVISRLFVGHRCAGHRLAHPRCMGPIGVAAVIAASGSLNIFAATGPRARTTGTVAIRLAAHAARHSRPGHPAWAALLRLWPTGARAAGAGAVVRCLARRRSG